LLSVLAGNYNQASAKGFRFVAAFAPPPPTHVTSRLRSFDLAATADDRIESEELEYKSGDYVHSRRSTFQKISRVSAASLALLSSSPTATKAIDVSSVAASPQPVEMKLFTDPQSLFVVNVPKRFYTLRRTAKGDMPDPKTGKGRRGGTIFTAGDMAKAEVIAIERYPTFVMLEDEGITPSGDLSTFPSIGDSITLATLLYLRRERDKPGQSRTTLLKDTVTVSEDGKTLSFMLKAEIDVQKPELLMEQMGVTELFRITTAKATLVDGQIMAIWASALSQDFDGPDGKALQETVESFRALEQQPTGA